MTGWKGGGKIQGRRKSQRWNKYRHEMKNKVRKGRKYASYKRKGRTIERMK